MPRKTPLSSLSLLPSRRFSRHDRNSNRSVWSRCERGRKEDVMRCGTVPRDVKCESFWSRTRGGSNEIEAFGMCSTIGEWRGVSLIGRFVSSILVNLYIGLNGWKMMGRAFSSLITMIRGNNRSPCCSFPTFPRVLFLGMMESKVFLQSPWVFQR